MERLVDLGAEVAGSGGPPSPDQQSEIDRLGAEVEKHCKLDLFLPSACPVHAGQYDD